MQRTQSDIISELNERTSTRDAIIHSKAERYLVKVVTYEKVMALIALEGSGTIGFRIQAVADKFHNPTITGQAWIDHIRRLGFKVVRRAGKNWIDLTPEPIGWWAKLKYKWIGPF